MIDIKKLMNATRVSVTYYKNEVSSNFVKEFRKRFELTQTSLANLMGVTKKAVEKWEQGTNKIIGSSAILFNLLSDNPELIKKLYQVKIIKEDGTEEEFAIVKQNSQQIILSDNQCIANKTSSYISDDGYRPVSEKDFPTTIHFKSPVIITSHQQNPVWIS